MMNSFDVIAKARELRALLENLAEALPDDEALKTPHAYPVFKVDTDYTVGERIRYGEKLYKVVQAHHSQADWTPDITPALFVEVTPDGVIPEWSQPAGAHDAYAKGDKVRHNDKVWVSDIDANVYEPGVYGWTEAV